MPQVTIRRPFGELDLGDRKGIARLKIESENAITDIQASVTNGQTETETTCPVSHSPLMKLLIPRVTDARGRLL